MSDESPQLEVLPHAELLTRLSAAGLTGIGVPRSLGGAGGTSRDMVDAVLKVARTSERAALVLACQRQFVEVLLRGHNPAAREHRLLYVLEGNIPAACAVTWSIQQAVTPVLARDTGRGWLLSGRLPALPNLGGEWFMSSIPVDFGGSTYAVALLSSDEDGVVVERRPSAAPAGIACAETALRKVFFREGEILEADGPRMAAGLRPFALALHGAIAAGAALGNVQRVGSLPSCQQVEFRILPLFRQVVTVLDDGDMDITLHRRRGAAPRQSPCRCQ